MSIRIPIINIFILGPHNSNVNIRFNSILSTNFIGTPETDKKVLMGAGQHPLDKLKIFLHVHPLGHIMLEYFQ